MESDDTSWSTLIGQRQKHCKVREWRINVNTEPQKSWLDNSELVYLDQRFSFRHDECSNVSFELKFVVREVVGDSLPNRHVVESLEVAESCGIEQTSPALYLIS